MTRVLARIPATSVLAAFALSATALAIVAQPAAATPPPSPTLAVIAGTGAYGAPTAGPATSSDLNSPSGVVVDAAGNVYIADYNNDLVEKVTPGGVLSVIAGNGLQGSPTAGPATSSRLYYPSGVALDTAGNLYIADAGNNRIEKVTPGGVLSTIAGNGLQASPTAGPATSSPLDTPYGVALDTAGNLYIADAGNNRIEKVTPGGTLSTIAGNGLQASPTAGPATSSALNYPNGVTLDAAGNLYITDTDNNLIEKVTPGGVLSVIAGNGLQGSPTAGPATSSALNYPSGVALDTAGNLYIADYSNDLVEKLTPGGVLSVFAGNGLQGSPTAGPATSSALNYPWGVALDAAGNVYIADSVNNEIEKVTVYAVAGAPSGVTATPGDGSATLTWNAPLSDGNSPITGYEYSADGGNTWTTLTYTGSGPYIATVTGLSNGSTYPIQVRAVNAVGDGAPSAIVSVTPAAPTAPVVPVAPVAPVPTAPVTTAPVTTAPVKSTSRKPTPPSHMHATTADNQVTVSFTPATPAAGSRVMSYQMSVNGGRTWTTIRTTGTSRRLSATITGLHAATTYRITIRALTSRHTTLTSATIATRTSKAWYIDPITKRTGEAPVPANPAAYRGPLSATTSVARSYNGTIAVPAAWARGHHLTGHQAVSLDSDGLFAFDSPIITAAGTTQLKQLVASLTGDKSLTCEGYSDYGNKITHENVLSSMRAQAVCAALKSFGLKLSMTAIGYGPTRPVVVGGTPANRAANRRVIIYINN